MKGDRDCADLWERVFRRLSLYSCKLLSYEEFSLISSVEIMKSLYSLPILFYGENVGINMSDIPMYLPFNEEQVSTSAVQILEQLLAKHYKIFIRFLILSAVFVFIGILVALSDAFVGLLLIILGVLIFVFSTRKKINIERLDLKIYPILALPYGDMKKSLLVDLLNDRGEDVVIKISRLERISGELNSLAEAMRRISQNLSGEEIAASSKLVSEEETRGKFDSQGGEDIERISELFEMEMGGEPMTGLEKEALNTLKRAKEILDLREYEEFNFKLFRQSSSLDLYPTSPSMARFLSDATRDVSVGEYAAKIDKVLESLKTRHLGVLDFLDSEVTNLASLMTKYYDEASEVTLSRVRSLHEYMLNKFNARLCSNCIRKEIKYIIETEITTTPVPILESHLAWEEPTKDGITYICQRCKSRYTEVLSGTGHIDQTERVVKIPYANILELKAWRSIYVNNLSEINRIISDARARKREKMFEAIRNLYSIYDQVKAQLIPIYLQLSKSYYEILAFRNALDKVATVIPAEMFESCMTIGNLSYIGGIIENAKRLMEISKDEEGGRSIIQSYIDEIKDYSSPRVASAIVNRTLIDMLVQLLSEEEANKIIQVYEEGDLDKIKELLAEKENRVI